MLKLEKISKNFGNQSILSDITLEFSDNQGIYGLLGRNGVGKTTLMKMIANQISDYSGNIILNEKQVKENDDCLQDILLFGNPFDDNNPLFSDKLNRIISLYADTIETFDTTLMANLMDTFELDPKAKYKKLSSGKKTLFTNALALSSRVPITLLDEPTNGLDSINRKVFFREMMTDYEKQPRMFIISTHLIAEVENCLTHAIMLQHQAVILDESIVTIQEKSHRITNYPISNKHIIAQEDIAGIKVTDIYDSLSELDRHEIESAGGKVDSLNLQELFNDLMGGKENA